MKKFTVSMIALVVGMLFFATNMPAANKYPVLSSPADGATNITSPYNFVWTLSGSGTAPSSYTLQIATDLNFTNVVKEIINITGTSYSVNLTGLDGNTTYFWHVIASYTNGTSDYVTGYWSFSTDPSLPVELSTFSASVNGNTVTLKWSTATEVNNYGFDIERDNGAGWAKIGFVAGSGNSNSPNNYSYVDQPNGGSSFSYRLKQIDNDGTFKYYDAITVKLAGGDKVELLQNSPNPFNPTTSIKYYVPQAMDVTITIYDILGRVVTKIVNDQVTAGYHVVYWNGKDSFGNSASSGVYLYRLSAGNFTETKKMNLMK